MEEDWGVLMFFMSKGTDKFGENKGREEMLIIFGDDRGRRGTELTVMSTVENKDLGRFTKGVREKKSDEKGFDTERIIFKDDELSYALGKGGSTNDGNLVCSTVFRT